jgi:hypothetical protein
MSGTRHYVETDGNVVDCEWDLRRVASSPPPPEKDPPEKEDVEEDCEHYRQQMKEYQTIRSQLNPQITKLYNELFKVRKRIKNSEGWKLLYPKGLPKPLGTFEFGTRRDYDARLWQEIRENGGMVWQHDLPPEQRNNIDRWKWTEEEKALIRKARLLDREVAQYLSSYLEAGMSAKYFQEAAEDCEQDKANPKGSATRPKPRPDTRFLDLKGGY